MLHEVQYSLIKHIKTAMPELSDVVWAYSGVEISGKTKPFVTVLQMPTDVRVLDKLRDWERSDYVFQVGLFCESASQLARMQDGLKRVILRYEIDLYDTTVSPPPPIIGSFKADITTISPVLSEGVEDATGLFRVYFDVSVLTINQL